MALVLVCTGAASGMAPAAAPYAQLLLHLSATTTVALRVYRDPLGCPIQGAGTSAAAMDLGTADATSANSCARHTPGSTYRLATSFRVEATCTGKCNKWNFRIGLSAPAQPGVSWFAGGSELSTHVKLFESALAYSRAIGVPLEVRVRTGGGTPSEIHQRILLDCQPTGSGGIPDAYATLDIGLVNQPGLSIFFAKDPDGVPIQGGAVEASLSIGTVSAYGPLPAGVQRPSVTPWAYTVTTLVDIVVRNGGVASRNYTMRAALASRPAPGLVYAVNGLPISTSPAVVFAGGPYDVPEPYLLGWTFSTASPGAGGPPVGAPIAGTIDFTATAN